MSFGKKAKVRPPGNYHKYGPVPPPREWQEYGRKTLVEAAAMAEAAMQRREKQMEERIRELEKLLDTTPLLIEHDGKYSLLLPRVQKIEGFVNVRRKQETQET